MVTSSTAAALAVAVAGSPSALAVSNGTNPQTTGCSASAITTGSTRAIVDPSNGYRVGTAELRYSTGCQSQWTRVNFGGGYRVDPSIWLLNQNGTNLHSAYNDGYSNAYTFQLSDMKYRTACGGVQVYRSNGSWVGWYYIGCA
nr:DUF2690 domain-containing protein [Motilibacter aurantiacus]